MTTNAHQPAATGDAGSTSASLPSPHVAHDSPPADQRATAAETSLREAREEIERLTLEVRRLSTSPDAAVACLKEAHEALDELGIPQAAGEVCNHIKCNCLITHRVRVLGEQKNDAIDTKLDRILGLVPSDLRQHSLGVEDCVSRLRKDWERLLHENHLMRHGYKEADEKECRERLAKCEAALEEVVAWQYDDDDEDCLHKLGVLFKNAEAAINPGADQ